MKTTLHYNKLTLEFDTPELAAQFILEHAVHNYTVRCDGEVYVFFSGKLTGARVNHIFMANDGILTPINLAGAKHAQILVGSLGGNCA